MSETTAATTSASRDPSLTDAPSEQNRLTVLISKLVSSKETPGEEQLTRRKAR